MDGFKWTVTGGIVGLALLTIGALVIIRLGSSINNLQMDWLVGISMPLVTGLFVWYVKFTDKMKTEQVKKIFDEIGRKADITSLQVLENKLIDHKENDNNKYEQLEEMLSSVDRKLDILLNNRR